MNGGERKKEKRGEREKKKRKEEKFPLTPMGVLAPVSAQRDTPLSPPSTSAEIFVTVITLIVSA